jgi:hypothetical protein
MKRNMTDPNSINQNIPEWITVAAAAKYLGRTRQHIHDRINRDDGDIVYRTRPYGIDGIMYEIDKSSLVDKPRKPGRPNKGTNIENG